LPMDFNEIQNIGDKHVAISLRGLDVLITIMMRFYMNLTCKVESLEEAHL